MISATTIIVINLRFIGDSRGVMENEWPDMAIGHFQMGLNGNLKSISKALRVRIVSSVYAARVRGIVHSRIHSGGCKVVGCIHQTRRGKFVQQMPLLV